MKSNRFIKFIVVYLVAKGIGHITGLAYNVFGEEFNLISLIMDAAIWVIVWFVVDIVFSKLPNK